MAKSRETAVARRTRALEVVRRLKRRYRDPECALVHEGPLQLLVATILSAQCTDVRVNMVTPALFARFPTAEAFARADIGEIEKLIRSTGFFRSKAKSIQEACRDIVERFGGRVPVELDALISLRGVGRKTANVVRGNAFDIPGLVVDTHVGRLSRRLGLTRHTDPVKVEFELMGLLPEDEWTNFSHRLIFLGRDTCAARKPRCEGCILADICPRVGVKSGPGLK
ncbi:MAG: endonuclease III [Deltaproteobacteria bacterium]|nr:endonuclease III [Deltaproteobacteria bacterium]